MVKEQLSLSIEHFIDKLVVISAKQTIMQKKKLFVHPSLGFVN